MQPKWTTQDANRTQAFWFSLSFTILHKPNDNYT